MAACLSVGKRAVGTVRWSMLIALVALPFRLEFGAVLYDVIGALFVIAALLQSTAVVVPGCLHGDAAACDRT